MFGSSSIHPSTPFFSLVCLALTLGLTEVAYGQTTRECRSEHEARLAFGICDDRAFDFSVSADYQAAAPTPEEFLGYPLGSWHTTYGRMEGYLAALEAALPDRVKVIPYGKSVEQQTMYLVVVTAERHSERLNAITGDLARLADPRVTSRAEAETLISGTPAVVWLNAGNDGDETAAFEAGLQIAYQVAAGEDALMQMVRDSVVTIVNMIHNPESHERMVAWYNAFVAGDPDPAALEHRSPWGMNTNNNHYQFDLNRDALGLTQTESRAVAAELRRWRPQVFVDLHGQTTQYFFPPAALPVMPLYPPSLNRWLDIIGQGNARAFDRYGWSYYTRDRFDLYYPGYWDTYPALHGATGMTYETDGGGRKGIRWRRDDGTVITFRDGIAKHFVASLATLETTARNRSARLDSYYEYFEQATATPGRAGVSTVVIVPRRRPNRAERLVTTLLRHGIEVARVDQTQEISATSYRSGNATRVSVPAGSYVVHLDQPNGILAATLLAPDIELPEEYAQQELARWARNARRAPGERERYTFYDVTAWSLPLAAGVEAYWSGDRLPLGGTPLELPEELVKAVGGWAGEAPVRSGGVDQRAQSSYVWEPGDPGSYRLLAALLGEGFQIAASYRPLVVDGRDFPRGTFIARVNRNPETLHPRIDALAEEAGVKVMASQTAFPDRGPTGTGSEWTRTLKSPRVAVLAGDGVRITSYGSVWFELERRVGHPFTAIRADEVRFRDLEYLDVLLIPDGSYGSALDERSREKLQEWTESGGTLIAMAGGARFVQQHGLGVSFVSRDTVRPSGDSLETVLSAIDQLAGVSTESMPPTSSPSARPDSPQRVPGAFLRTRLDPTHWLTMGYEDPELPVLVRRLPLRLSEAGINAVTFAPADRVAVSGFTWPGNTEASYPGQAYATVDDLGRGRVILFSEDPLFRGVFDAPAGLLMNAIFLGAPDRPDAGK